VTLSEVISLIVALTPWGLAILGLLQAQNANRRVDHVVSRTEAIEQSAVENHNVATEAMTTAAQTLATFKLLQQQAENQSNTTEVLREMLEHMASADAKQNAERQGFMTSIDKMAAAVAAMTSAITLNNTLTVEIKNGLSELPQALEDANKEFMGEVVKHMADTLDPRDMEIQKELENINARLDRLFDLVTLALNGNPVASTDPNRKPAPDPAQETPTATAESPAAQPVESEETK